MKRKNIAFLCVSCLLLHSFSVPVFAVDDTSISTTESVVTSVNDDGLKSPVHISCNFTENAGFTDDALINLQNTEFFVNGESVDIFSSCENNCSSVELSDMWSVNDQRSVSITGLSPYITAVKVDGITYGVENASVSFDVSCKEGTDEDNNKVIQGVCIEFLCPQDVLYLHIFNPDNSAASGAYVKGCLKQINDDETSTSLTDIKAYTADGNGIVLIPCPDSDSELYFDYEISTATSAVQGQTSSFLLDGDSIHYDVSLSVVNDSLFANEADIQKDPLNASIKEIQLQPTYLNFDDFLVAPSNCSIVFEDVTTKAKISVPLSEGFNTKFNLPEGIYAVSYIGDANYNLSGSPEFDTSSLSTFLFDVQAENVLSVHKIIEGKETEWKFTFNNKDYTGNGIVRYAVAKGIHYLLETDKGVMDVVVSDISSISFDLSSGKYTSTSQQLSAPKTGDTFLISVLLLFFVLCGIISFYFIRKKILNKTK